MVQTQKLLMNIAIWVLVHQSTLTHLLSYFVVIKFQLRVHRQTNWIFTQEMFCVKSKVTIICKKPLLFFPAFSTSSTQKHVASVDDAAFLKTFFYPPYEIDLT